MDFEHAAIALLASVVLVLAGMVGWLYWQQTRMFQNMNNIVMAIGEIAQHQTAPAQAEPAVEDEVEEVEIPTVIKEEDDRVSVDDEEEEKPVTAIVDGPPPVDNDDLDGKTTTQLRDILTKRGIPFGKRDAKGVLISLLKATS